MRGLGVSNNAMLLLRRRPAVGAGGRYVSLSTVFRHAGGSFSPIDVTAPSDVHAYS